MNASTMFDPPSPEEEAAAEAPPRGEAKVPIVPVPDDAPEMRFRHPEFGDPTRTWAYHDAQGKLVGYVGRFDYTNANGEPAKDYLPITFCEVGKRCAWRAKGIPDPRPLFNLPGILARPDATVIVTEGEKAAEAAAALFPDAVATTPPHGAKSPHKADWSALAGRKVVIATDHDDAGLDFGDKVYELLRAARAEKVQHLQPDRLGSWTWQDGEQIYREEIPKGWDLADALDDGWTAETVAELWGDRSFLAPYMNAEDRETQRRRAAGEPEDFARWPFRMVRNGVEKRIEQTDKDTGIVNVRWKWFCSLLEVGAETRSDVGDEWGRLLSITDRDGRTKDWAMPMSMLAGDGTALRERLLSLGLILAPGRFAKDALHEYISTARPQEKARCVTRIGWQSRSFISMDENFGDHHG